MHWCTAFINGCFGFGTKYIQNYFHYPYVS
jgi:hypothetical protein